jgi:hypothetical protein
MQAGMGYPRTRNALHTLTAVGASCTDAKGPMPTCFSSRSSPSMVKAGSRSTLRVYAQRRSVPLFLGCGRAIAGRVCACRRVIDYYP